jgi:hypothetical protein
MAKLRTVEASGLEVRPVAPLAAAQKSQQPGRETGGGGGPAVTGTHRPGGPRSDRLQSPRGEPRRADQELEKQKT